MKIISKYVLREHLGPLAFALTALTSLMLLNYIAKNFGQLVGKGLPTSVIVEFFALAVPFTVAMTLPMAVLVAVLYAFSRLAAENEVTAFKASGVSMQRLMLPALAVGFLFSLLMVGFNDQLLPRANHRLATLQRDIVRASPTFALKEQIINPIKEGQLYLRAGRISRGSSAMRDVVVYDLSDPERRRTIYADSGSIALAPNREDLYMTLYDGVMREVPTDSPEELTQLHYRVDQIKVKGVATQFEESQRSEAGKSDREMSVCEMQERFEQSDIRYQQAQHQLRVAMYDSLRQQGRPVQKPAERKPVRAYGLGGAYCDAQTWMLELIQPREARAAVPARPGQQQQQAPQQPQDSAARARRDSIRQDSVLRAQSDSLLNAAQNAPPPPPVSQPGTPGTVVPPGTATPPNIVPGTTPTVMPPGVAPSSGVVSTYSPVRDATDQVRLMRLSRNRYEVEIQKKFSLAAACVIFVLIGAPLALRFPRGGVGMVIGVSLAIFAVSYVGLIGGEALADKGLLSPVLAMWAANIILFALGLVLTLRMGRESATGRGGGPGEWLGNLRVRRQLRAAATRTA